MKHFYKTLPGLCTFEDYYAWVAGKAKETQADWAPKQEGPWHGVEIGVFGGQSAAFLATELINLEVDAKLDLVDEFTHPQAQIEDVVARLAPVKQIVGDIHQGCSWEMADRYRDRSLDFCFIDTEHTLDTTRKEIAAFLPKMKIGGIMGGHDFSVHFPGVIQAVTEAFSHYEVWRGRNDHSDSFLNGKYMPCWSTVVR